MMWTDAVHMIFLTLLLLICRRILLCAKQYGHRLRNLRASCQRQIRGERAETTDEMLLIQKKSSKQYAYDNTRGPQQRAELERVLKSPNIPTREILFRHIADVEDMPRMMAFYKDEIDDHICVACTDT